MTTRTPAGITELLAAAGRGEVRAKNRLWALVYEELHGIAQRQMAREGDKGLLQTTALVNEAYVRLVGNDDVHWNSRRHFFAAAANAMRRICVDHARKRGSLKRGGGARPDPLEDGPGMWHTDPAEVLAVDEALEKLRGEDPRKAEVVMLRYFAGLTVEETAQALELSPRTVDSDWRFARTWLYQELTKGDTAADRE